MIRDSRDLLGFIELHGATPPSVRGGTIPFERIKSQCPFCAFFVRESYPVWVQGNRMFGIVSK